MCIKKADKAQLKVVSLGSNIAIVFQIQLVEGASGDWIPRLKEQFGVETFDLVFLDHWKDRYLPDTKLLEASFFLLYILILF